MLRSTVREREEKEKHTKYMSFHSLPTSKSWIKARKQLYPMFSKYWELKAEALEFVYPDKLSSRVRMNKH